MIVTLIAAVADNGVIVYRETLANGKTDLLYFDGNSQHRLARGGDGLNTETFSAMEALGEVNLRQWAEKARAGDNLVIALTLNADEVKALAIPINKE